MNPFKHKPVDPEVKEAYNRAYREERLNQATIKGKADAQRKAAQKPFYQKLGGAFEGIAKEFSGGMGEDPFGLFPKKARKTKRKRKSK